MGRRRSGARNTCEYLLARSILWVVRVLPGGALAPVSRGLGGLLATLLQGRRRVVAANVALAYGEAEDAPDPHALCCASLANLCLNFIELQRLSSRGAGLRRCISFRPGDRERLLAALEDGPMVFAASHFGAYEVAGLAAPVLGVPITTLVRPLDNPLLERFLHAQRRALGQKVVTNRGGMRDLLDDLRGGRSAAVLVDLNHRPASRIFVDYFGTPAATAPTAALLAVRTGRPLACIFARRKGPPLSYELELGALHRPRDGVPRRTEQQRLMQAVTDDVEARVREEPGLWLWTHRRWKTRPAAARAAAPTARSEAGL